jgi:hypothetical protein
MSSTINQLRAELAEVRADLPKPPRRIAAVHHISDIFGRASLRLLASADERERLAGRRFGQLAADFRKVTTAPAADHALAFVRQFMKGGEG